MTVKIDGTNTVANPAFTGADTDTGLQCGTDELKLVTGGTARATVDSSGRLLVGTSSVVNDSNSNNIQSVHTGGSSLLLGRDDTSVTNGNLIGGIRFFANDPSGYNQVAKIVCDADGAHDTDDYPTRLEFYTTADGGSTDTERIRITSDGTLQLRNSPGIDFSQLQTNTSGMTSETLDSYEEGTWTPTTAGDATGAITDVAGFYTKIGNLVTCTFCFNKTANFTSDQIGGLPFSIKDIGPNYNGAFLDTVADRAWIVANNTTRLQYFQISNGSTPAITFSARCTFTYITA